MVDSAGTEMDSKHTQDGNTSTHMGQYLPCGNSLGAYNKGKQLDGIRCNK
jgi:hypothetical protein